MRRSSSGESPFAASSYRTDSATPPRSRCDADGWFRSGKIKYREDIVRGSKMRRARFIGQLAGRKFRQAHRPARRRRQHARSDALSSEPQHPNRPAPRRADAGSGSLDRRRGYSGVDLMRNAGTAVAREAMRAGRPVPPSFCADPATTAATVSSPRTNWLHRVGRYASPPSRLESVCAETRRTTRRIGAVPSRRSARPCSTAPHLVVDAAVRFRIDPTARCRCRDHARRGGGARSARHRHRRAEWTRRGYRRIASERPAADCTVTFTRKKPGHVLLPGRDLCGDHHGCRHRHAGRRTDRIGVDTWENDPALWRRRLPRWRPRGNKYTRGHALLYGGYPMTGAARLSARAAARVGAGLTTIAVPEAALQVYAIGAHQHHGAPAGASR